MSKQKITTQQKKVLLDILASKPNLRKGKFSHNFTHKDAQKEWEEVTNTLNAIPGARKDWKAWRKTWQDILSKTKQKSAIINKIRRGTGGGPPPSDSLDTFEEGVAALLHPHAVRGHEESVESAVYFEGISQKKNTCESEVNISFLDMLEPHSSFQINDPIILPPSEYADADNTENSETEPLAVMPPVTEILEPHPQRNNTQKSKKKKINLKTLLEEKVKIKQELLKEKKKWYEASITLMERQTTALEDISRAIINISNNNHSTDNI